MTISNALALAVPLVHGTEGCELAAYLDTLAAPPVWTIGHGTTRVDGQPVHAGMICTRRQADGWAAADLETTARAIGRLVKVAITDHQFAALISLAYNIGIGDFATSSVLEALNLALYQRAADRFLEYDHAGGREIGGLATRRARERDMFLTGMGLPTYPGKSAPIPAPKPAGVRRPAETPADRLNDAEIKRLGDPPAAA